MGSSSRLRLILCAVIAIGSVSGGLGAVRERLLGVFIEAKDLAPSEAEQLRAFTRQTGRDSWLVYGFRHGSGPTTAIRRTAFTVYLQPDAANGRVRRGRVLVLTEPAAPAAVGPQEPWRLESTRNYAQVLEVNRPPDRLFGKWDLQRPFVVEGEFDDQSLLNLVDFIRGSPEAPGPPGREPLGRVTGVLPISEVRRNGSSVEVKLNRDEYVFLPRRGRLRGTTPTYC